MKATFRNSFAKRSLVLAATTLPSLYAGLVNAQTAAPAPVAPLPPAAAPAPAPAPLAPAPVAVAPAPMPAPMAAPTAPAVVTPPASETPPAPAAVPETTPTAATAAEEETYKHVNMGVWMRLGARVQNPNHPKEMNRLSGDGEVELHFSNQMRKYLAWTANFVATYTPADRDGSGSLAILDLIAQFEPDKAFNIWAGRMLVPSDRSNFSGPYFMAPWNYPGLGGPRQGVNGRNQGLTIWGDIGGGMFKYYLGAFNLNQVGQFTPNQPPGKVLFSGRLSLDLLSPEPGYYNSSTYYGKDILSIAVGGQFQQNGDGAAGAPAADYSLFNADALFEKDLAGSGVVDVEAAMHKYMGDNRTNDFSYFALASYLTPDLGGVGKLQPLLRVQQLMPRTGDTSTVIDAQVGYVVDNYATRFALGYTHGSAGAGTASNAIFGGIQLQK